MTGQATELASLAKRCEEICPGITEKVPALKNPELSFEKYDLITLLTELSSTDRETVREVLDYLGEIASTSLHESGCGEFTLPGLVKLSRVQRNGVSRAPKESSVPSSLPKSKIRATVLKSLRRRAEAD